MPFKHKRMERRVCDRFTVFGVTVTYSGETGLWSKKIASDERHPVINMSLGGLAFASQDSIKSDTTLVLTLRDANDEEILTVKGVVARTSPNQAASYAYLVAVQFNSYGPSAKQNSSVCLAKMKQLQRQNLLANGGAVPSVKSPQGQ